MRLRLNKIQKALLPLFVVLFIVQVDDARADLFGWDEYEKCTNDRVAIELRQKYCSRDLDDAKDRIDYVEAKFKEAKIKLEGKIANLESQLDASKEELAKLEKNFREEKTRLENIIAGLNSKIASLTQQIELLKTQMEQQEADFLQQIADRDKTIQILKQDAGQREQELLKENQALQKRYEEDMAKANEEMLAEKNRSIKALEEQRNEYEEQLIALRLRMEEDKKKQLAEMEALRKEMELKIQEFEKLLSLAQNQIEELKQIIRDRDAEIATLRKTSEAQKKELERMLAQERELANQLQSEIAEGAIRLKKLQGKLIINIDNRISFASGSAELKKEIKAAFEKISAILVNYPENQIRIEGHTDNEKLRAGGKFQDNWELSTARALSVLRFLLQNKSLDKKRFAAVGYGEYNPIANNDTPEGKSLNRRVDIVVVPKID